jgi:hypothetical protein
MSLRWSDRRAALFAGERARGERSAVRSGLRRERGGVRSERAAPHSFTASRGRFRLLPARSTVVALLVGASLGLLGLAALRISILRTRYELAATLQHETALRGRERSAAVDVRVARDPQKLRELAARQGFARPERVIDLSHGTEER